MIFQQRDGVVGSEDPVVERSFGVAAMAVATVFAGEAARDSTLEPSNSGADEAYRTSFGRSC